MLIYFTAGVRQILWERSSVPDEIKEMVEKIPEKAHLRMKDYINGRDGLKQQAHRQKEIRIVKNFPKLSSPDYNSLQLQPPPVRCLSETLKSN